MPAATPVIAIPYPLSSEAVALGAADIQALADALDGTNGTAMRYRSGAFAARPAAATVPASTVHRATNVPVLSVNDGAAWHTVQLDGTAPPIGAVSSYLGTLDPVDPDGVTRWLVADHRAVSRTTYGALFALVGTTYGNGNGTTTFNLPELRGRVPVGAGTAAGLTTRAVGATGGEETHTLASSEVPATSVSLIDENGNGVFIAHAAGGNGPVLNVPTSGYNGGPLAGRVGGGGGAHNNMPPFVALTPIIRVL